MTTGGDAVPLPPRAGPVVDADGRVVEAEAVRAVLSDDVRPDESEPGGRVRAMDAEGIDQTVLFPTVGLSLSSVDDPAAARAAAAASNDWLGAYCAADPRRLFGAAALPLQDPAAAADELRRAVSELGLVAGFLLPGPYLGRTLGDAAFDLLWAAAADLDVPIGLQTGAPSTGVHPFGAARAGGAELIASGALERHPGLRLAFLGASGAWAPSWLHRHDAKTTPRTPTNVESVTGPSEDAARHCAIGFAVHDDRLPGALPFIDPEQGFWGSSGPSRDAALSGVGEAIRATVAPCTTASQVHILGLNARRLYRLPSRRTGLPGLLDDYFTAVTAQEIDLVRALFTPDAVFESGDIRLRGLDAICGYYLDKTFTYEDFRPTPGTPTFDGTRIEVDIDVHLGGTRNPVHDVFETDGTRITALRVSGFEEALDGAGR